MTTTTETPLVVTKPARGRPPLELDEKKIRRMHAKGKTYAQIAAAAGCSLRTVSRTLQAHRKPARKARDTEFSPEATATILAALTHFAASFPTPMLAADRFPKLFRHTRPLQPNEIADLIARLTRNEKPS